MGTVFKKTFTKPMPAESEILIRKDERYARWKDSKGKTRTALITAGKDGQDRLVVVASTFTAKYRDGKGIVREVKTGCRDETAARRVLADLERRAELIKAKVMTSAEDAVAGHQGTPLSEHIDAYIDHLIASGTSKKHRDNVSRQLNRLVADCSFTSLADLDPLQMERWLANQSKLGAGARTGNTYLGAASAFATWCADPNVRRLCSNPFLGIAKANEQADIRRKRRALDEKELLRLLDAARRRPLLDALTIRRGKRKGEAVAKLSPKTREELEWLGRERSLLYKTLLLTGLRRGELESLTVGQLDLNSMNPIAILNAADEKNREGSEIAIRMDLAEDLGRWLADKLARLQSRASRKGEPIPEKLPSNSKVFNVPKELVKIMNRDLALAGIPKVDDRGRVLDIHALRHTFGTLLSKCGVTPRTAQQAMRHSDIDLTMNVYTDPRLLDLRGAVESLPALPLQSERTFISQVVKSTGTDDFTPRPLAPMLAPTPDFSSDFGSIPDKSETCRSGSAGQAQIAVSAEHVKRKTRLTNPDTRAGDRIRTGDVQLGKLAFYR